MKETIISLVVAGVLIVGAYILSNRNTNINEVASVNNVTVVDGKQVVDLTAKGGYQPRKSLVKAGIPTILRVNTDGTFDCSSSVRIPSMNISENLPPSGTKEISLGVLAPGILHGTCSMGMYPFELDVRS